MLLSDMMRRRWPDGACVELMIKYEELASRVQHDKRLERSQPTDDKHVKATSLPNGNPDHVPGPD